jgi:hypothetical protein
MEKRQVFEFYGHLHRIETKVDGSGRIHIDCDKACIRVLHELQLLQIEKGWPIAIAAVPLFPNEPLPKISVEEANEFKSSSNADAGADPSRSLDGGIPPVCDQD